MKKLVSSLLALTMLTFSATMLEAQIRTPAPSPTAELSMQVGLTDVHIIYSRPSAKDREIFSEEGLVPYGDMWRTGANAATKFTFSDAVTLGGQKLEGGSYAVLTQPGEDQWEIRLYPYESTNWGAYVELNPAASFTADPREIDYLVETFLININNVRHNKATIDLMWENTLVSLPLEVDVDDKVMGQIERTMGGPTANDYMAAANYYLETGKDLEQAAKWAAKANEMNPRFWTLRTQAQILAEMGKYDKAIEVAKKSKEMAQEAGNKDYVRMNEASIEMWMKKK